MNLQKPDILAVRAVNQYRRRDILTYLSLRYYLDNVASRTDNWAKNIATNLVVDRNVSPYFSTFHFKEFLPDGKISHRRMFLPGANEALAEAALLSECSNNFSEFINHERVFSYRLCRGQDKSGIFRYYFDGLQKRQQAIAKACDSYPDGIVAYTDIKSFYPSIKKSILANTWVKFSNNINLQSNFIKLGEKLIEEHSNVGKKFGQEMLTGPMFSHMMANIVLNEIDKKCSNNFPAEYFRYVDDIVLVGNKANVEEAKKKLCAHLYDINLYLHEDCSPKNIETSTNEWLKGRNDFSAPAKQNSWISFIGNFKRYLLKNIQEKDRLSGIFQSEGFRLPIPDYSSAIHEKSYLERIRELFEYKWFRKKSLNIPLENLLNQGKFLRKKYFEKFSELIAETVRLTGYHRKRIIPKLRFRASRLVYLADESQILTLYEKSSQVPELVFHTEIFKAICCQNVDTILKMGTNVAQATAQPLKAMGKNAITNLESSDFSEEMLHSLSIFFLNHVSVRFKNPENEPNSELISFSKDHVRINHLRSNDPFIQEISCLHGLSDSVRHRDFIDSVFDQDEDLIFDAIEQLEYSD